MGFEKELKKFNIIPISEIAIEEKNYLLKDFATNIINCLPDLGLEYNEVIMKLYKYNIVRADMRDFEDSFYFYKNQTIYLKEDLDVYEESYKLISSFIYCIQEVRSKSGGLEKLGLCSFNEFKIKGLGLNDSIIRYISNKISDNGFNRNDNIYYTDFYTNIIVEQIVYITKSSQILNSAVNSNMMFRDIFTNLFQEDYIYTELEKTFEIFFNNRQKLLKNEQQKNKKYEKNIEQIRKENEEIFFGFQTLLYIKYFNMKLKYISEIEEIEECNRELEEYMNLIYNKIEVYMDFMDEICLKLNRLENKIIERKSRSSLAIIEKGYIYEIIKAIKKIFFKNRIPKEDKL